jgi:L-threonylcarbamoyladenylate synthase
MATIVQADAAGIAAAIDVIRSGGIAVLPTDTVYGFFGNALDEAAVERVYAIKKRDRGKPFVIHTNSAAVENWAELTPSAKAIIAAVWPRPLGLVVRRNHRIPAWFTQGLDTVAVMTNANPVMAAIVAGLAVPVFGTTLNYAGEPEIRTSAGAGEFAEFVDLILAGDHLSVLDKPSSIIDCTTEPPAAIRISATSIEELREIAPDIEVDLSRRK